MTLIRSILLFTLSLAASAAFAQWSADSSANTLVAGGPRDQADAQIVGDGTGGVIIAWRQNNLATGFDVFAQRIDTLGSPVWPGAGVAVCTTAGEAAELRMAADGRGGAVFVWRENRGGSGWDIYAQRVDSNGALLWAAGGVPVCTADSTQDQPQIDSDGDAGAVIAWHDIRNGTDWNIFAQRIDSSGALLWTADGVTVSGTGEDQNDPRIAGDGSGGAVIAWEDLRSSTNFDIYAQRIGSTGAPAWTADGIAVSYAVHDQVNVRLAGDGAGRTVVAWEDARSGTSWDIYAQRLNGSGVMMWNPAGEAVCTAPLTQGTIDLADDGAGGAFLAWQDGRNGINNDIYAQRLNNYGGILWAPDGVAVCQAANQQSLPRVAPDGTGGAYVVWHDLRDGAQYDIFAQRIAAAGSAAWAANGKGICVATGDQIDPAIVSVGGTGAVAAWKDGRNGAALNDIYAQNMLPDGTLGLLPWVLATAGPHGSVSPAGVTPVPWGGSLGVSIVPVTGYHVDSVFVNGSYIGSPSSYTVENVFANTTVHAVFAINVYYITAAASAHGSISQPGMTAVVHGQTQAYSITPDPGYDVGLLLVDGMEAPETTYYVFTNITASHTIEAWFGNDTTKFAPIMARWNIVSVPSVPPDYSTDALFPGATAGAFSFDSAYRQEDTMRNGPGYWLKFADDAVVTLIGTPLTVDTFDVAEGWNMIGSISDEVAVGAIESVPPGIVTSQFFAYAGGYLQSAVIRPGRGYWVKTAQTGRLVLSSTPTASPSNRITIVPTEESPPPPPGDGPVAGSPEDRNVPPPAFRLEQNYPNPFNPSTVIGYRLPEGTDVKLEIFNITGERVALLADGYRGAGSHSEVWDAAGHPGGVYFCRLSTGTMTAIRKIVLLK